MFDVCGDIGSQRNIMHEGPTKDINNVTQWLNCFLNVVTRLRLQQRQTMTRCNVQCAGPEVPWENPQAKISLVQGQKEVSGDPLLRRLVAPSPKSVVTIGGIELGCVLDSGAETSIIPASVYHANASWRVTVKVWAVLRYCWDWWYRDPNWGIYWGYHTTGRDITHWKFHDCSATTAIQE